MIERHSSPTPGARSRDFLVVNTRVGDWLHHVELSGELDLHRCAATVRTRTSPVHQHLSIDLSGLTFMDCAPATARLSRPPSIRKRSGGSATLIKPVGEPGRLLGPIEQLERCGTLPAGR